jgi:hypothetical protein
MFAPFSYENTLGRRVFLSSASSLPLQNVYLTFFQIKAVFF